MCRPRRAAAATATAGEGGGKYRERGGLGTQPVIVCAEAGTGKTWSSQQLVYELAELCEGGAGGQLRFVPLLVYVQRLVRVERRAHMPGWQ